MSIKNLLMCSAMLIFAAWANADHPGASDSKPTTEPASKPAGKIVATVNGEPIYESELMAALPDDAFQDQIENTKKAKLNRLIEEAIQSQFLKDRKITVSDDELDKGVKEFEEMVKTPGCPCCGGGYASLDQFMKVNAFTMSEVRRRVGCDVGIRLYVERLAKEQTQPQALAEAVQKHRAEIEADYVEYYAITFEYARDPGYSDNEKIVEAKKEKLANEALQRLKKGDSFETVAKEMSEDKTSAPKGGELGCIRADTWGPEVQQVILKLEPGIYSSVVKAPWGCCIVMRKKLTEEDVHAVVKELTKKLVAEQAFEEFTAARERAKIQRGGDVRGTATLPASQQAATRSTSP